MLKISPNSPTHFNVFDTDLSYSEDGTDAIALKSQFVMSIVETAKGMALTSNEKTIIDRCVRQLFKEFVSAGGNSRLRCSSKKKLIRDISNITELARLNRAAA